MRLFVAVDLGDALQRAASALARQVREEVDRVAHARATWVAAGNLHLTLRFLGELTEPMAERVREVLSAPLPLAPFEMQLAGLGAFPPAGRPRVLWAGVTAGAAALAQAHDEVEARLAPLGLPPEDRPFRAHLTLARFKEPASPAVRVVIERFAGTPVGASRIADVVLYRSQLGPKGPTYTALTRAPLEGAPGAAAAPSVAAGTEGGGE